MDKRPYRYDPRLKVIVRKAIDDYRRVLRREDYRFDILWQGDDQHDEQRKVNTLASIGIDRRYLSAGISIYPALDRQWRRDKNPAEVRAVIAHEIAHTATEHMKDLIYSSFKDEGEVRDAWESCTTQIGNLMTAIKP